MTITEEHYVVDTALTYIKQVQFELMPALTHQPYKGDSLFSILSTGNEQNPSYRFDKISNQILFNILKERDFSCHVYSEEEHAWKIVGDNPNYYVICDPFCNSFLASRSFRDAAVAVCITDLDGQFIACAIGDLQIKRVFFANTSGAYVLESDQEENTARRIHVSNTSTIDNAFVVTSLLKSSRRSQVSSYQFFHNAKIIHGVDGAIMIARLAAGDIDAYLDPIKGQPLYEVPCCELILKAGGIVTDNVGRPFRLSEIISNLGQDGEARFKIVAAATPELHSALLQEVNLS